LSSKGGKGRGCLEKGQGKTSRIMKDQHQPRRKKEYKRFFLLEMATTVKSQKETQKRGDGNRGTKRTA